MSTSDPDREPRDGDVPVPPDKEPSLPLDVDKAFAAIVAGWGDDSSDTPGAWPAQEDLGTPRHRQPEDGEPSDGTSATGTARPDGQRDPDAPIVLPPTGPAMPDPFDSRPSKAEQELEERFVPPEPPPLPKGDLMSRLAWAGTLGGPAFLVTAAMAWRDAPQLLVLGAVGAFVAGFVALVVRMPQNHDDDGDDGAVV